jgi:transcriptional regulator with XRE-family HTH domain
MSIGNNIKILRTRAKKSQQEIADLLDVDRKTYAKWETDDCEIKSSYIPKLADAFDVEIADLFKEESKINISPVFNENNNSVNTAIIILTDKEAVDALMGLLGNTLKK